MRSSEPDVVRLTGLIRAHTPHDGRFELLVDEIRVTGKRAVMCGSYAALTHAVRTICEDTSDSVPTFRWIAVQRGPL